MADMKIPDWMKIDKPSDDAPKWRTGSFMEKALDMGAESDPMKMEGSQVYRPVAPASGSVSAVVPAPRDRIIDWLNNMASGRGVAAPLKPLSGQAADLVSGARERGDAARAMQGKRVLRSLNAPTTTDRAMYRDIRPLPSMAGPAVQMPAGMTAPPTDYTMGGLPIEAPPVMDEAALMALARLRGEE